MTARAKPAFDGVTGVGLRNLWMLMLFVAVLLTAPATVFCAEVSPVVVLVALETPAVLVAEGLVRTRAELEAGGFTVHLKTWDGTSTPTQLLEEATAEEDVTAIIVVAERDQGLRADIALRDRLSGMITPSFVDAIRSAVRENAGIILVGGLPAAVTMVMSLERESFGILGFA